MTRQVNCFCGAAKEVTAGSVLFEAKQSGFLPVMGFDGTIRWYCPVHAAPLVAAARTLLQHCGPNSSGMLPPWLRKAAES